MRNSTKVTGQVLTLGFDLDGVIIDHTRKKILLAAAYGHKLKPRQTPAEVIEKILPQNQLDEIKYLLYTHPDEALEHPLMSGVKSALHFLKSKKIPFYLISRRKSGDLAIELLKLQGLWPVYFDESNTFFVDKKEDKNIKAKELRVTHYLDDEHPVLACLADVPSKYLFDPHRVWLNFATYPKIHSWPEFIVKLQIL